MLSTIPSDMETMSDFLWNKSLACISVFIFNCADFLSQISVCNHREPLVPKIGKNHWKTIVANGWSDQKPSMVMVRNFQNHRHSIAGEKKPSPFHRHEKLTIAPVYSWCWGYWTVLVYFSFVPIFCLHFHTLDVKVEGGVDFSLATRDPESGKLCVLEEKEVDTIFNF